MDSAPAASSTGDLKQSEELKDADTAATMDVTGDIEAVKNSGAVPPQRQIGTTETALLPTEATEEVSHGIDTPQQLNEEAQPIKQDESGKSELGLDKSIADEESQISGLTHNYEEQGADAVVHIEQNKEFGQFLRLQSGCKQSGETKAWV